MNIVNLTPHNINIIQEGQTTTYEPSGCIPRVSVNVEATDNPLLYTQIYGEVTGLPEPQTDTIYIVSTLVLNACPNRTDLYAPLTAQAIRNEQGQIIGVPGLVR